MNVSQLQRLYANHLEGGATSLPQPRRPMGPGRSGDIGFSDTLKQAVDQVDHAQKSADAQVASFVAGEQDNVHEVMISMNQARVSFQMMTEVRNRMLETYQELMRMQV